MWLTQLEIAALFHTIKRNAPLYVKNVFGDRELSSQATVKGFLTVHAKGACATGSDIFGAGASE